MSSSPPCLRWLLPSGTWPREARARGARARRLGRVATALALGVLSLLALGPVRAARAEDRAPETVIIGGAKAYKVAVQRFAPDSRSESEVDTFHTELTRALGFSGDFDVMDPKAFLEPAQTQDYEAPMVACDNWRGSGANALVQGEIGRPMTSRTHRIRYRVWDIDVCRQRGEPLVVEAGSDDLWLVARRVADEIVQRFTGRRGVAATQLAYLSDQTGNKEVYVMEAVDGSRSRRVTSNGRINLFPDWSRDARRLIYTSYRGGLPDIWSLGRGADKGGRLLMDLPPEYKAQDRYRAIFGPGRGEITFVMHRDGNTDIYTSEASGRNLRRLTSHRAIDLSPSFSPDGKRMVFVSDRTGSPQLYLMDLATREERRLTYRGQYNASPAWSPTGEWIVYAARTGLENLDLYLIDPDTLYTYPLVLHPRVDQDPAWSPDGRKIAFASDRRGTRDIYVVNLDGKDPQRITRGEGDCTAPAWAPWVD